MHLRKFEGRKSESQFKSYFKTTAIVMADGIINGIYGLEIKRLSASSKKVRESNPRLSKTIDFAAKLGFWYGVTQLGALLGGCINGHISEAVKEYVGKYAGTIVGYTIAFVHPTLVNLVRYIPLFNLNRGRKFSDEFSKPGIRAYSTTFALAELISMPLALFAMQRVLNLAGNSVTVGIAVASTITMTLVGLVIEYPLFKYVWKKFVLKGMKNGNIKDELKGFSGEFNPSRLLKPKQTLVIPSTSDEYVGQIWGVFESNWIWVQGVRILFSGLLAAIYSTSPKDFMDLFFKESAKWKIHFDSTISAKNYAEVEQKIGANEQNQL
ncbi:hypothetical protein HZC08_01350 [Candidatus Micrarchaeota archaeon]|nr:hypothetical protein [Candidatus Micrarchaeota archaeon]